MRLFFSEDDDGLGGIFCVRGGGGGGMDCTTGGGISELLRGLGGSEKVGALLERRVWSGCVVGGEEVDGLMEAWKIRAGWSMN